MYIEKQYIIDTLNQKNKELDIGLTYDDMDKISSEVSRFLDTKRLLSTEQFLELLEHNYGVQEQYISLDFNDEIVDIELVGEEELIDIEVTGDNLFYANDILTHNSGVNSLDADNSAVADSIGTVQTADFLCFLLQTEELKARNEIVFKITKNRFNGRTDFFSMNIDYTKMRFTDIVQTNNPDEKAKVEAIINTELEKENIKALDAVKNSLEANWN